jgi:hypothetical protein
VVAAWKPWHGRPAGRQGHEAGSCLLAEQAEQFLTGVFLPGDSGCTGHPCSAHQRATIRGDPGAAPTALCRFSPSRGTGIVLVTSVCPILHTHLSGGYVDRDRRDSDAKRV